MVFKAIDSLGSSVVRTLLRILSTTNVNAYNSSRIILGRFGIRTPTEKKSAHFVLSTNMLTQSWPSRDLELERNWLDTRQEYLFFGRSVDRCVVGVRVEFESTSWDKVDSNQVSEPVSNFFFRVQIVWLSPIVFANSNSRVDPKSAWVDSDSDSDYTSWSRLSACGRFIASTNHGTSFRFAQRPSKGDPRKTFMTATNGEKILEAIFW